jgi:hypothetical protein
MQKREYDRALELLRPAVAAEPYHVTALYNLGVALTRAGRAEEGQQTIAKFQALREAGYGTAFSNNYLEQGRYAEAVPSTGDEGPAATAMAAVLFSTGPALAGEGPPAAGATLVDLDLDGDLDLVDVRARSDRQRRRHLPRRLGRRCRVLAMPPPSPRWRRLRQRRGGRPVRARQRPARLLHQRADGVRGHHGAAASRPPRAPARRAVRRRRPRRRSGPVWRRAPVLLRNNGNGTLPTSRGIGMRPPSGGGLVPTDFDNRRDVDLLSRGRGAPACSRTSATAASPTCRRRQLAALEAPARDRGRRRDVNKDGFTDFFFARGHAGTWPRARPRPFAVAPSTDGGRGGAVRRPRQRRPARQPR